MKKAIYILILSALLIGAGKHSSVSSEAIIEQKVDSLLRLMTLDEKIGQMNQLASSSNISDYKNMIANGQIGSFLNEINPETANQMQKITLEQSRLKIPILFSRDVIHGFKTILPIPLGQAASWNPELIEAGARVAATEATEAGIRWTFAPMIDVTRDPRWGRIAESLGEDPLLTSTLGAAMVRGFQGKNLSDTTSMAACLKHFAAYGAVEGGRDYNTAIVPEQVLRETYLPSFKASVDAGAASLMVSFNEINGVPSSGNSFLLRNVLRNEWKFKGVVVSDWGSISEMIPHGICANEKDAAKLATNAGVDMEMVSSLYISNLKALIKENKVQEKTIDEAVRNILRLKFKLGLFERPYTTVKEKNSYYSETNLNKAKELAQQSIVLLKNANQTLPLKCKSIAIIGPMADAPYDQMGTWTLDGEKEHTQTPLKAFQQMFSNDLKLTYVKGLEYSRDTKTTNFEKALQASQNTDATIIFIGEESLLSGEARCRADINLPGEQTQLISELKKSGKPLILVVMAGRPLTIEKEVEMTDAVLYAWHPGTMGGPAIAEIIMGKAVPSGKLPVTFPKAVGQIPIYYAHKNTGRPAHEPLQLISDYKPEEKQFTFGYCSYYLDIGVQPLFPFGFGLSYTTFEYSNLKLSSKTISNNDKLTASCTITNTGNYDANEIVQLYTRDLVGSITRPVKELKGFQRVCLKKGESKTVSFNLTANDLSFWNNEGQFISETGDFKLWIGSNSQTGLEDNFRLQK